MTVPTAGAAEPPAETPPAETPPVETPPAEAPPADRAAPAERGARARLMSGNEALARGAWQAGVVVGCGYPGTPSTEILEALAALPDVDCQWSPNEKVALEVGVGASLAGGRVLVTMKHVGLNVAADPFFSAAYMGVNGGLVVVSADDPGMHSSQNEQDNRLFARAARVPLLEPATPAEALDYTAAAFALSERFDTPVLLRTTSRLSHGKSAVPLASRHDRLPRRYRKNAAKNVVLPAHGRVRHRLIEERRMPGLVQQAERMAMVHDGTGDVAFISAGIPYLYVREAFPDAPVLKLGMTHPLPADVIRRFAAAHPRILVVEELEPMLDEQVRALGIATLPRTWPRYGELSVDALRASLSSDVPAPAALALPVLPVRPPVLCPGCSHRGAFHALNRMGAIVSGDIGCYTLGAVAPLAAMDACMNMGASIGMAAGMAMVLPEADRARVVAVIGDSTFYHSGITGLVDVVYNGGAATVLVLDNHTTAMTGHQDHPGTGRRLNQEPAGTVSIEGVVRGLGVTDVRRLDPYDLMAAWRTLDDAAATDAPTVLLAETPCVLKERVVFGEPVSLDADACTDCHACAVLGCPAIQEVGGRLDVDPLQCTACTHCQQVCADCSAGIDIPLVLELVDRERLEEAYHTLVRANPFPAVSGRVCPHPCDHSVNALGFDQHTRWAAGYPELLARFPDAAHDGQIAIRDVERWLGDWGLEHVPGRAFQPTEERGQRVAVVGGGPAGLAAAWHLRRGGFRVTVFEAADAPGGMLRHGIPAFRLPRWVVDGEVHRLEEMGVRFRCGVRVGRDLPFEELVEAHEAVIVATGAGAPREAGIEGAGEALGVWDGVDFLERFNRGDAPPVGERVAVVGGGNTAVDCARAARRVGAQVSVVYRRGAAEMPAIPDEVDEARDEGVEFHFHELPRRVVTDASGGLVGVELVRMAAGAPDASGRAAPVEVAGSEHTVPYDTVILAIGERPDLAFLDGADIRTNGRVEVRFTGATSREGVFACGDAAFGHGTVTQAIATGRRAAEAAASWLAGRAR